MKYSNYYYVIPKKLEHENKKICYKWNYEPDSYDLDNINPDQLLSINKWCPVCYMWKNGLSSFYPVVAFHKNQYNEPVDDSIRQSRYNIRNMGIGNRFTEYIELWNINRNYFEIRERDIELAKREIERLGEPKRISDIKALKETREIIEFIRKWLHSGCFNIVYETYFDL